MLIKEYLFDYIPNLEIPYEDDDEYFNGYELEDFEVTSEIIEYYNSDYGYFLLGGLNVN